MKIWIYSIAVAAGALLSAEGAIYGLLGNSIGKLESSLYNFMTGTIILAIVILFLGKGSVSYAFKAPKWQLIGGLLGTSYLTILVFGIPIVGVGVAMTSVIVGQMTMSMVIEERGWLGSRRTQMNKEKLVAGLLMIISLILIY
ncbi:DMT family transporter [Sporolactobacillus shoreicorticis]|uniref:DMT family transporter n=1 Tax=Sporolactobacillus shoreicorticis TaxID=1923877 RepID=A0ABW5RYW2_9BACL|nr:DMT family transporter [Sporolactobacillus shoreicorticis]MCO7127609.1 DMT family transporter [Sporolactobacillus shoreicorticis]